MSIAGQQVLSTLFDNGALTVELVPFSLPDPQGGHVVIRVEAAPINPSDLGLIFGPADMDNADYSPRKVLARMPVGVTRAMKARHGLPMPSGNECAGVVVAASEDPAAQALLGKRVACTPGTAFATHALADARLAIPLADGVTAEQGASSFVNSMTALSFIETMRCDGFTGVTHIAAASNLGQMLVRICAADRVPLVNVVRSADQVDLLKGLYQIPLTKTHVPTLASRLR